MEMNFASKGVANAGLTTGIIGTALGAMNVLGNSGCNGGGLLGGLFGNGWNNNCGCGDSAAVNRYEMAMQMGCAKEIAAKNLQIAELNNEVKLRDSTIYTDSKSLELYRYIDTQFNAIQQQLSAQAVNNQATKDSFQLICERLECEKQERKCADNSIVNYVNATFYPKMVADVTTGTTTTAQSIYNPLPCCGCNC
jgi:hypothetical protein